MYYQITHTQLINVLNSKTVNNSNLGLIKTYLIIISAQTHRKETPFGGNLGYHAYMYNTPKDFRLSELEFMEYAEIENHDDYYTVDEKDFVHVQDQRGYYIMYEAAEKDLK